MALYVSGVVTCQRRMTAAVELAVDERNRLLAGELPCPVCGSACTPTFQPAHASGAYLMWSGARWSASDAFDEG